MPTSAFWSRITRLYRSQASPVVLCMQNSMICTIMTSLYWFQPLSVFFSSFKTVTFWPVLQVCMGPSPNVWFCAFKSATLAYELLFSIGPSPHVWFLDAKQRILDWNYTALWVEDHTFCFCMQNFDFWTRITSLYGSQTWPVILCMYNSVVNIKITSLYGFQPFFFFFSSFKTVTFVPVLHVCMGPSPHVWFCEC